MEERPEAANREEGGQPIRYEDFSIKIGGRRGDGYPVFVQDSPAGQGEGVLRLPFQGDSPDLDGLRGSSLRDVDTSQRRDASAPHEVGDRLFRALFADQVRSLFERSMSKVEGLAGRGLRIKLHFMPEQEGTAKLLALPWEMLYWQERRQFLSLSRTSPVVRFLSLPLPPNVLPTTCLRILGIMSKVTPPGARPLDLEKERDTLERAFAGLTNVSIELLPEATPTALRRALHEKPFHVLLFMGHGTFHAGEGALLFEQEDGGPDLVPGATVANIVRDFPKAMVLVDALDESDRTGLPPDANTLYLPSVLPAGIYFVATTRRTGPLPRIDCDQQILDIEQDSDGNIADVREFVASKLPLPGIQAYIVGQKLDDEAFVAELVDKSQGNFMYLYYVLPEIERGAYKDRELGHLPVGLQGYYEDHWRRMRHRDETAWFEVQLPILVALTVVKEPVSIDLIADFADIQDRRQIRRALQDWDQFLYTAQAQGDEGQPQKRYRLYHESFHEFIADKDEVADERVSLKGAHGKIADVLWRGLYGSP